MSSPHEFSSRSGAGALFRMTMAVLLLAGSLLTSAVAQESPSEEEVAVASSGLRAEVEDLFRVLQLKEGVLLQPLSEESSVAAIEVGAGGLSADGEPVTVEELEELLGSDADIVLRLADLSGRELKGLFAVIEDDEVVALPALPAEAPEEPVMPAKKTKRKIDPQVVVGSALVVEEDEVAREVVVIGGPLTIKGEVRGGAAAIGGSVTVSGEVDGDLAAIGGSIYLEDDSEVNGDVVAVGGRVEQADSAEVTGEVVEVPFGPSFRFGGWPFAGRHVNLGKHVDVHVSPFGKALTIMWDVFMLVLLGLLACLCFLLARNPMERMGRKVATDFWKAGLVGLVAVILFPALLVLVTVILVISIIGIPLVILLPFAILALILVAFLGYFAVALQIGRWTEKRFGWDVGGSYVEILLGIVILQAWSLIGGLLSVGWGPLKFFGVLFITIGVVLNIIACLVGLGAALLTRFGTLDTWGRRGRNDLPPAPLPPATEQRWEEEPAAGGWEGPEDTFSEEPIASDGDEPESSD